MLYRSHSQVVTIVSVVKSRIRASSANVFLSPQGLLFFCQEEKESETVCNTQDYHQIKLLL